MGMEENNDRHAFDAWEVLKIVLDQNPSLKQRIMIKIRELRENMNSKKASAPGESVDAKGKKK